MKLDPFKRRLALSYLYDWLLVVIMTAAFFAIDQIPPFHRRFSVEDKTIMFPYTAQETIPVWLLMVIFFFGSIINPTHLLFDRLFVCWYLF